MDFLAYFKDEKTCLKWFEGIRFRNGDYCPHCGHTKINRFADGKRYRCAKCRVDFTIKTKTIFGDSKTPIQKWLMAIYLLSIHKKGISSIQLSKEIGVQQRTAWFMDMRIRKAMKQGKGQLFGTIELDETYVGGEEKNKHANKRTKHAQGRSTLTKSVVMGSLQRGGNMKAKVLDDVKMRTIEQQIIENVKIGSKLYTDDFLSYSRIGKLFPHEVVAHGKKQYVRGDVHSNSIESFWAIFKRGYKGTYHHMSKKHLQRYVDEFVYRFNGRFIPFPDLFTDLVERVSENGMLNYKTLTA